MQQMFLHYASKRDWDTALQSGLDEGWRVVPDSVRIEIAFVYFQNERMTVERYFCLLEREN